MRSARAQTGPPAMASTARDADAAHHRALAGHVRAADDEQPQRVIEADVVRDAAVGGDQRMPELAARRTSGPAPTISGIANAGCSNANEASDDSASISPTASIQSPMREPERTRQRSMASATCVRPEQQHGERREELIAPRVEQRDQLAQSLDLLRRRAAPLRAADRAAHAVARDVNDSRSMRARTPAEERQRRLGALDGDDDRLDARMETPREERSSRRSAGSAATTARRAKTPRRASPRDG